MPLQPTNYRSNNSVHGNGEFLNATLFDKANPPFASRDGNAIGVVNSSDDFDSDGNGLGKKPAYIGNNSVKLNNVNAQKFVNFSTLYNVKAETSQNPFSARTSVFGVPGNTWRPKFHDTPKVDVLAQQATRYKTHWGYMNTIAEAKYIRVTNLNTTDSPFEILGPTATRGGTNTENVGNKVRYCWIVPKIVRQAFNSRRASATHLPSPNFFEQSANIDLKNQLKYVMIPAGTSIVIQKKPTDAVFISNLDSGHGGGTQSTIIIGETKYLRNFQSNTIVEPVVLRNS